MRSIKILIVEDDASYGAFLVSALKGRGMIRFVLKMEYKL